MRTRRARHRIMARPRVAGLAVVALAALPGPAAAQQGWAEAPQTISAPALTGPAVDAPRVATLPDGGALAVWVHRRGRGHRPERPDDAGR